jgi:deazaflavin-dependent oxidoreductase (nitroreductase family)
MPFPGWLARANRSITNPLLRRVATRLPGFGVVHHVGRRSGRAYATPVNVFRRGDALVIALTYGADRDWVRNAVAQGRCTILTRGTSLRAVEPRIFTDVKRQRVPGMVRPVLRLLRVTQFLELRVEGALRTAL